MPKRQMAFAAAPPATVVEGMSYSTQVKITNLSTRADVPWEYTFKVKFELHLYGMDVPYDTKTNTVWIAESGEALSSYVMTVPTGFVGTYGTLLVRLLTSNEARVLKQVNGDFLIASAAVEPSGLISWTT